MKAVSQLVVDERCSADGEFLDLRRYTGLRLVLALGSGTVTAFHRLSVCLAKVFLTPSGCFFNVYAQI